MDTKQFRQPVPEEPGELEPIGAVAAEAMVQETAPAPEPTLRGRAIRAGILIVLALVSLFGIAPAASNPATYREQIKTLDEKKANVMGLTATSTAASAAVSLLPDDAGTPIAEKLADISSYLIIILSVIYLEKFLLTIMGGIGFGVLVPIALAAFAAMQLAGDRLRVRPMVTQLAMRALVFGLALALVVPASVWVTDQIDATFADSINYQIDDVDTNASAAAEKEDSKKKDSKKESNIFTDIADFVKGGVETVTSAAQDTLNSLTAKLNQLVDTVAVMIVTSCLVPLIVLVLFFWLANNICGIDVGSPDRLFAAGSAHARRATARVRRAGERARAKQG